MFTILGCGFDTYKNKGCSDICNYIGGDRKLCERVTLLLLDIILGVIFIFIAVAQQQPGEYLNVNLVYIGCSEFFVALFSTLFLVRHRAQVNGLARPLLKDK